MPARNYHKILQLLFAAGFLIATVSTLFTTAMAANATHKVENTTVTSIVTIAGPGTSKTVAPTGDPAPLNTTAPEPLNTTTPEPLNTTTPEPSRDEVPSTILGST
ncbi:MAG: hypothetical protein ACXACI_16715, partial [Candidatus Hodarchaeales archaeon]